LQSIKTDGRFSQSIRHNITKKAINPNATGRATGWQINKINQVSRQSMPNKISEETA
jgi:hypothetical protein